ncbi:uncharacterized protein LOC132716114 [Ruditapes philippinarum]|uniref:uncharacterized protein LOC132716114 n=1 Tax=Ruditapes philippinarum TaxID=129788 RepID=UPI00295C32F0|nr:uncharacterized protein LOC132716114 [Ruditapes philippinarum]
MYFMGSDVIMAHRVMLFLLFMNWCGYGLAAIHQARRWRLSEMPCKVSSPFNPDLASAFLEAEILPTSGCMTNATSRKSGAEIHVINYQGSKEQNVELLLNDFEKKGFDEPFVIILSSNVTVYWQIRLRQNPKNLGKHTFVVSTDKWHRPDVIYGWFHAYVACINKYFANYYK